MKSVDLNMRKKLGMVSFLMVMVLFSACMDEQGERRENQNVESIKELNVASSFDWKTTNKVEVMITGLPIELAVNRKLALEAVDGNVFYAGLQSMNEDFKMEFELPSYWQEITLEYGDIRKTAEIVEGKVTFDYVTERSTEDIED